MNNTAIIGRINNGELRVENGELRVENYGQLTSIATHKQFSTFIPNSQLILISTIDYKLSTLLVTGYMTPKISLNYTSHWPRATNNYSKRLVFTLKNYSSLIAFLGILTLIIFPLYEANSLEQDYLDIVSKSFHTTQGEFYELYIEAWEQIKKEEMDEKELLELSHNILRKFGLTSADCSIEGYEDFISIYCQEVLQDNTHFSLVLQSYRSEDLEAGTILGIQVNLRI